jgi:hypothetical protein
MREKVKCRQGRADLRSACATSKLSAANFDYWPRYAARSQLRQLYPAARLGVAASAGRRPSSVIAVTYVLPINSQVHCPNKPVPPAGPIPDQK